MLRAHRNASTLVPGSPPPPYPPPGLPLPRSGLWSFTEEAIPPPCPDLRLALKREMPNPARTRLSILSVLTPEQLGHHRRRGWSKSRLVSFQFQTATLSLLLRCFPRRPVHTERILTFPALRGWKASDVNGASSYR